MRAFAVQSFGELPSVRDIAIPEADRTLLVRVTYAGVNPVDYKLVERLNAYSSYPFVVGTDFAGVVERVLMEGSGYQPGDRIFGMARKHGAYAEYTSVVPNIASEPVAHIPEGISDEQAAALPIPAITALGSLDLLKITTGQKILVTGANGGVGGYSVQMAHDRGAYVIATVRGDEGEARRLGAEEVYDTNTVDVIEAIRAAHSDGVDAVLDLVNGPDAIRRNADILKSGGHLVSTIYAADEKWFAERHIEACNIAGSSNRLSTTQGLKEVVHLLLEGKITARIRSTVELEQAGQTLQNLRKGGLRGKALIRI
jgi:NADPH:quinone reductase-like Zn-dependent oxidoreductase